jgi:glycerate-2-kinase
MRIAVTQPQVRAFLGRVMRSALAAVDPAEALRRSVQRRGSRLRINGRWHDLRAYRRIVAVGAGKASAPMAAALEDILGPALSDGLVVVKYGHGAVTRVIRVVEAGHPVPDETGEEAAGATVRLLQGLSRRDLVFILLSGGASSLWPSPAAGVTLRDKQRATQLLLRSGATIQEMNVVRKHLSAMKGGRLAAATSAQVISLILSDVIGDDLGSIGSGPTAPDPSTFHDAAAILRRYRLWPHLSSRVRRHVLRGTRGAEPETAKPGSALFRRVQNVIIGNNRLFLEAAAGEAKRAGFEPVVLTTSLTGEAREAAKWFGAMAREIVTHGRPVSRPACLLAGGELTVTVRGSGLGGRAQEFALAAAQQIQGFRGICIAALGSDGNDGPTDAAGAVVDGNTVARAAAHGVDAGESLQANDAYRFFKSVGGHITTGPTGTNVNDLYLLLAL